MIRVVLRTSTSTISSGIAAGNRTPWWCGIRCGNRGVATTRKCLHTCSWLVEVSISNFFYVYKHKQRVDEIFEERIGDQSMLKTKCKKPVYLTFRYWIWVTPRLCRIEIGTVRSREMVLSPSKKRLAILTATVTSCSIGIFDLSTLYSRELEPSSIWPTTTAFVTIDPQVGEIRNQTKDSSETGIAWNDSLIRRLPEQNDNRGHFRFARNNDEIFIFRSGLTTPLQILSSVTVNIRDGNNCSRMDLKPVCSYWCSQSLEKCPYIK